MSRVAAYQEFRDRLLSGELQPGQFVTQKELAELAGVPIGTAREAIQKLEHDQLLKVHPQRGIQVADITTKFIRDAYGLRRMLELQAVLRLTEPDAADTVADLMDRTATVIEEAKAGMDAAVLERAVEVDWEMHDRIIEATDNDLVREIYQINAARLRLIKASNRFSRSRAIEALGEHMRVLKSCRDGDAKGAVAALGEHIGTAQSRALQGQ